MRAFTAWWVVMMSAEVREFDKTVLFKPLIIV
jgi:hypothetical protein